MFSSVKQEIMPGDEPYQALATSYTTMTADLNTIASFISRASYTSFNECQAVDCIVICVSQILWQAEELFHLLEQKPDLTKLVIIVGGVGHSTQGVYDAIAAHPRYHSLSAEIMGLPESRVVECVLSAFFDVPRITSQGCEIIYEDKSTNCGSNAIETRKLIEISGIEPQSFLLVQDPTMLLRSRASFEKVFGTNTFRTCAGFTPRLVENEGFQLVDDVPGLWSTQRYISLLMGEIPRLRDDRNGYGPQGKDFITHVDIPKEVESAYSRAVKMCDITR